MQGQPQRSNGAPGSEVTPSIFDAMGAYSDTGGGVNPPGDTTILIRNHENRRRAGEIPVRVPEQFRYDEDPSYNGGCTKLVVRQTRRRDNRGQKVREYEVVDSFNILGGTDTNCAGGELPFDKWITCEEVVNRSPVTGKKHGYNFEIDVMSDGPVKAVPILAAGRFVHAEFKEALADNTAAFGKPVVLVHGDTHTFRTDKPLPGLPNFTRVETFGSPNVHWVRASVDARNPEVFSFRPEFVDENVTPWWGALLE